MIGQYIHAYPAYTVEAVLAMPWYLFNALLGATRSDVDAQDVVTEAEALVTEMNARRAQRTEQD